MSKHTPGPWTPSASRVNANNDERICWIAPLVGHDVCGDREIANARLIAAAPELLEACRSALALIDANFHYADGKASSSYDMPVRIALVAAIAKAEGREHEDSRHWLVLLGQGRHGRRSQGKSPAIRRQRRNERQYSSTRSRMKLGWTTWATCAATTIHPGRDYSSGSLAARSRSWRSRSLGPYGLSVEVLQEPSQLPAEKPTKCHAVPSKDAIGPVGKPADNWPRQRGNQPTKSYGPISFSYRFKPSHDPPIGQDAVHDSHYFRLAQAVGFRMEVRAGYVLDHEPSASVSTLQPFDLSTAEWTFPVV